MASLIWHGKGQLLSQGSTTRSGPASYHCLAAMQALVLLAQVLQQYVRHDHVHVITRAA